MAGTREFLTQYPDIHKSVERIFGFGLGSGGGLTEFWFCALQPVTPSLSEL